MSKATARILIRNLESNQTRLDFAGFLAEELKQGDVQKLRTAREFFSEASYGEWTAQRDYPSIPPVQGDSCGFGSIPSDVEDLLLLLRLYRPGDLAFVGLNIEKDGKRHKQYPYRAISSLVGLSTRQFQFQENDCQPWTSFQSELKGYPAWKSSWFDVARRFFLYGGGKEFKPYFPGEVDRIVDYFASLEAVLVPEKDFLARRIRERAMRLLDLANEEAKETKKLLTDFYDVRSAIVHGSELSDKRMSWLQDRQRWWCFEERVRGVLIAALRQVPDENPARQSYLAKRYDVSDEEKARKIVQDFNSIRSESKRRDLREGLKDATYVR